MDADEPLASCKQHLARSVSKTGEFFLAKEELEQLRGRLERHHVVSLYEYIRDASGRVEYEWRPEFVAAFPEFENALPEPLLGPAT
jgi:hypothetical protein